MELSQEQRTDIRRSREQLMNMMERETETTLKVLRAYPEDQSELRPHPRSKSARELAWIFTLEQMLTAMAIRDQMNLGGNAPPAPDTMDEVIARFEESRRELLELLRSCSDEQLSGTVSFPVGPGKIGDIPKVPFLWFMLHDQIHHRGQLSVYLRMAGGKVPSIYGPTADEPWM